MKIDNASQNVAFQMNYKVLTMRNVKKDFTRAVEKSIKDIPDKWGDVLKRNNYKLYCSNSIADIFENEKLAREGAPEWEAVTCTYPLYRFMAITTRVEPKDIQKVVNHEAAHGILDCEGLMQNRDLLDSLYFDTQNLPKRHPDNHNYDIFEVNNLLIKPLSEYFQNEVCADILAWIHTGGGLWGSGYKNSIKNKTLLKENFPDTFEFLSNYKIGERKSV
ncbi:hypothetical protein DBY21_03835 [Candidatus Gastranaerophilales bacterium]|nr:MAG: hypothetical protein DBY21_05965 [Candidatus Gastranaerophilales bacterium]PWL78626.1 MAG: hypothetical protein DBY21_03835 [Candidatus Gastranaerophilales bacterium]